MRSTSPRRQSGQSLVEVVVASAILGLTVVVALETIGASISGGRQVVHQSWGQCMVRETAGFVRQAPWASQYPSPRGLSVAVAGPATAARDSVQTITITAHDPDTGATLWAVSFLKAAALQSTDSALPNLALACPKP